MSNSAVQPKTDDHASSNDYLDFAIKTVIAVVVVSFGLGILVSIVATAIDLAPVKTSIRKAANEERTRIRLKGLLTTNPAVHYRISEIEEGKGNLRNAIEEIELGIGLLELHSTDRAAKERFARRLNSLKAKAGK